jgi:hypothetical protein
LSRPERFRQIAWFVGLWVAGVACILIVGFAIRSVLM